LLGWEPYQRLVVSKRGSVARQFFIELMTRGVETMACSPDGTHLGRPADAHDEAYKVRVWAAIVLGSGTYWTVAARVVAAAQQDNETLGALLLVLRLGDSVAVRSFISGLGSALE